MILLATLLTLSTPIPCKTYVVRDAVSRRMVRVQVCGGRNTKFNQETNHEA